MGFFFTTALTDALAVDPDILNGKTLGLAIMSRAPLLDPEYTSFTYAYWLDELVQEVGWRECPAANYARMTFVAASSTTEVSISSSIALPATMGETEVRALVFYTAETSLGGASADPVVLFGTSTLTDAYLKGGDLVYARNDLTVGSRWLWSWSINGGVVTSVSEGPIVTMRAAPSFEGAYTQHMWMFPQRVNYIANPSFEKDASCWQTNGNLTRVAATTLDTTAPSPYVGHAYGVSSVEPLPQYDPEGRIYLRSAPFYPKTDFMTFQMNVMGTGTVRVGLMTYRRDYTSDVDWGVTDGLVLEEWDLSGGFSLITGLRRFNDSYEAALLIEVRGYLTDPDDVNTWVDPELYFDQVLTESGALLDWPYFDGDSTYGAPDDYVWYGSANLATKQGVSYSLWYNNKAAVAGRMFGRFLDDDTLYTSADEQLDSLVTQWTPAGTCVVPHWNVLSVGDTRPLPEDRSAIPLEVNPWW